MIGERRIGGQLKLFLSMLAAGRTLFAFPIIMHKVSPVKRVISAFFLYFLEVFVMGRLRNPINKKARKCGLF